MPFEELATQASRVSNVRCVNAVPECFYYFPDDALRFEAVEEEARRKLILPQFLLLNASRLIAVELIPTTSSSYWMTPSRLTAVEVDAQPAAVNWC